MGESKRRKPEAGAWKDVVGAGLNDPRVRALLEKGQPINVHLLGSMAIMGLIRDLNFDAFMAPENHVLRLAFSMLDRIRTGEIESWPCFLCRKGLSGLAMVSVMAVVERTLGDPVPRKPGIIAPICHVCDGVSTEETQRRVMEMFRLLPLQEGHA